MKKIGTRRVYFWGSGASFDRAVRKDEETGKYFVTWYGQSVEVTQADGCEGLSNGWKTVEAY